MPSCCKCRSQTTARDEAYQLICVLPQDGIGNMAGSSRPVSSGTNDPQNFRLLDPGYIEKHFKLPKPALYLDPFRRPLITFPMGSDKSKHFTMGRKSKINQMILDGFLSPSEAISAPSVFPYAKSEDNKQQAAAEEDDVIYLLQIPDIGGATGKGATIQIPRSILKMCKKSKQGEEGEMQRGGGPLNRPKPWLLSRHTDFDLMSQW